MHFFVHFPALISPREHPYYETEVQNVAKKSAEIGHLAVRGNPANHSEGSSKSQTLSVNLDLRDFWAIVKKMLVRETALVS